MNNPNPIKYSDLIQPDDSIQNLISQLKELVGEYDAAKQKIQGAAADVVKSIQGVSGASEEQRKTIQLATEQSEKLVAEYRDVTSAQWKVTQAFAEAAAAKKESTQIDKLITQINTSAEGSYNKLSAQYRLNKIRLNEMSAAERAGTEAGRQLEAETNAIYQKMKDLQEATGKHQLNVGNYADAAKGLNMELRSLVQQMAYLKSQGQQNSDEYKNMSARAGQLKDALMDANSEVKAMASDTRGLDTIMGAAGAASGGIAAVTGAMNVFGVSSQSAAEAQKTLGGAITMVSGLTAIQNALQKESNLMTGIRVLQTKAATKAENLDTAAKSKNIVVTTAATAAQKLFNLVAAANPYVLLAIALVTVVGALIAFTAGASKAAKEQKRLNDVMAAHLTYLEKIASESVRISNERITQIKNELDVAKARNASIEETRRLEDELYQERVKAHNKMMGYYGEELANLDANRARLMQLERTLTELQTAQASGQKKIRIDVDLDGKIEKVKVDEAIEAVQGQIDNLNRSVQVAVDLKTEGADISKERAIQLAQRIRESEQIAKAELDAQRQTQDAQLALIGDSYKKASEILKANAERRIEDIKIRLQQETTLTVKARKELNAQILLIQEQYERDLQDLRSTYAARDVAVRRESQDIIIALMAEGADKQREELRIGYERQIEDLQTALATNRDLTETEIDEMYNQMILLGQQYRKELAKLNEEITVDQLQADAARLQLRLDGMREDSQEYIDLQIELLQKQRDIELAQNAQLAEDVRQNDADINAKWDAVILKQTAELTSKRALMILDSQQALAASELALIDQNERQKTQFQLRMERERLQKILELDAAAGYKMTETERKTMENTVKAIEKESKKLPYNNLYELLGIGLDSDQQSALNTAIGSIKESISSIIDSWTAAADAAVDAANKQVESAQKVLDAQIAAREAGYANDVATAQKELDLAKKTQAEATKEKEKAQKAQSAIDTLTQASSLVTASANIWSALGSFPPLAVAAIATMWSSFALAKVKAAQVTKTEQYAEGTVELLQGGSHASGHDIDLGRKPDGTRRRAEGGEYFAVINRRNSRRYGRIIPDVINAFNNGTFAEKYQRANAAMGGYAVNMGTDVSGLEKDVAAIRKQGLRQQYIDGDGNTVIVYKNMTRKILKN